MVFVLRWIEKWGKFYLTAPPFAITGITVRWNEETREWEWILPNQQEDTCDIPQ